MLIHVISQENYALICDMCLITVHFTHSHNRVCTYNKEYALINDVHLILCQYGISLVLFHEHILCSGDGLQGQVLLLGTCSWGLQNSLSCVSY